MRTIGWFSESLAVSVICWIFGKIHNFINSDETLID